MDWGAWAGERLHALRARDGGAMAATEARGLDFRPEGGESPREVQARLAPLFGDLAGAGRDALAVTHRGVVRAALGLATGWDFLSRHRSIPVGRGILMLVLEPGRRRGARRRAGARHGRRAVSGPVLFWTQHLLGSGHPQAARRRIARALADRGVETVVALGAARRSRTSPWAAHASSSLPPVRAGGRRLLRPRRRDGARGRRKPHGGTPRPAGGPRGRARAGPSW